MGCGGDLCSVFTQGTKQVSHQVAFGQMTWPLVDLEGLFGTWSIEVAWGLRHFGVMVMSAAHWRDD